MDVVAPNSSKVVRLRTSACEAFAPLTPAPLPPQSRGERGSVKDAFPEIAMCVSHSVVAPTAPSPRPNMVRATVRRSAG